MFSGEGDGIKNYYTLAWFLEHNDDWLWFEGMNYPDQELLSYTDAQPALAWVLKLFGIGGSTAVGIINFLMILSIAVAAWVFFLLIKTISGPSWLAVAMAVLLALVCPQIPRIAGHYSLAYVFVVPLFTLFIYRMIIGHRLLRNAIALSLLGLILGFIHPYMLLMQVMFGGGVWFFVLIGRRIKLNLKVDSIWLGALIIPVGLVQVFMALVDNKIDRPEDPWGFWVFQGSFRSVFSPQHGPLKKLGDLWGGFSPVEWETAAFVGTAALTVMVGALIVVLLRKAGLTKSSWVPLMLSSLVLLFFSFGYPFNWFPSLADTIPFIKNFRVLGRFSWPFVCVFGIVGFALLANSSVKWKYVIFIVAGALGILEAVDLHSHISTKISNHENVFEEESQSDEDLSVTLAANQHQVKGVLSLPYFHVGSEKITKGSDDLVLLNSMKFSYHIGVPLLASQMSRSSLSEAKDHLELIAPTWYEKEIGDRLGDGPWLVVMNRGECNQTELDIWNRTDSLTAFGGMSYGILTSLALLKYDSSVAIDSNWIAVEQLESSGGMWLSTSERVELNQAFTEAMPLKPIIGSYTFSCWYWNPQQARTGTAVILERVDQNGIASWDAFESIDRAYAYSGDSIRFELNMKIQDDQSSYRILFKQPDRSPKEVWVNHFLLAPSDHVVYHKNGRGVSINNHVLVEYETTSDSLSLETATFGGEDD